LDEKKLFVGVVVRVENEVLAEALERVL